MSDKPVSKFRAGTLVRDLVAGDWEDLTMAEIAEVLDRDIETVRLSIHYIKKQSGYSVPYKKRLKCGNRRRMDDQ